MPRPLSPKTERILEAVGIGLLISVAALLSPRSTPRLLHGVLKEWDRRRRKQTLSDLKRRGYVDIDNRGRLSLARKGEWAFRRLGLKKLRISRPRSWDGLFRIVLFDIPTKPSELNERRDALRDKLQQMGFVKIRESAWVHAFPCEREVRKLTEYYEINEWVTFAEVTRISEEQKLRKRFSV